MTDRELLEAAAKTADIDAEFHSELGYGPEGMWLKGARSPDNSKYWNPLTDDGDALRLAVKLGIDIVQFPSGVRADAQGIDDHYVPHDADPYVATRRAIVRAAAGLTTTKEPEA